MQNREKIESSELVQMNCPIRPCSRKSSPSEVKDAAFPRVHPIHFPSLGLSFLLHTARGLTFQGPL